MFFSIWVSAIELCTWCTNEAGLGFGVSVYDA